jgi:hypothetical protein
MEQNTVAAWLLLLQTKTEASILHTSTLDFWGMGGNALF